MINVLFASGSPPFSSYEVPLRNSFADAGLDVHLAQDIPAEDVDYVIYGPQRVSWTLPPLFA